MVLPLLGRHICLSDLLSVDIRKVGVPRFAKGRGCCVVFGSSLLVVFRISCICAKRGIRRYRCECFTQQC